MRSRTNAPCSPTTTPGLSFLWLGLAAPSACLVSTSTSFMDVDDRRKRQTSTATPAEPGDLPWVLAVLFARPYGPPQRRADLVPPRVCFYLGSSVESVGNVWLR